MTTVTLQLLRAGWCTHLECMADRGGRFKAKQFPALCGLIRHPTRGWMLYDTGYAEHFFHATERLPQRIYRAAVPIQLPAADQLGAQLAEQGIRREDIGTVIVSHYHGDHVSGLRDFPNARFIALDADTRQIANLRDKPWRASLSGHLPALLPDDFASRLSAADTAAPCQLPAWMAPLHQGLDLFGDGSVIGVPLPGHSAGHLGLLLPDADGGPAFLIGDACWSLPACRDGRLPPALTLWLAIHDAAQYRQTFAALGELVRREPDIAVLPSHCIPSWEAFRAR
ncbi:MBL fold metallo-hydrolase [Pseudomonas sp. LRF_L74]|uniref:MBL fold metallo-hydrolase n=1 Tax=Pseudomonas sp. LRF_L74 TaxID=3369422 RepID=UPI003F5E30CA